MPVTSQWEIGFRAARIEKNMPKFLGNFDAIWEERKWELELGLGYFESYDFAGKSLAEIGQYLDDARTFHNRAWEIHFEIMYPLLAIYLQLYGLCAGNGIDPGNIAKMLQGRDSKIMETDRAMWDLADEAKRLGIADLFEHEPDQIRDALSKAGGNASIWLTKFDDFLKVHGWRTEGIADINIPSWIENQASPLGQLRNFVQMEERHDFDKSLVDSHRERDEAIDAGPLAAQRRQPRRVQRAARHLHGRQLRVVERGPQLLHRPACRRSRFAGARWPPPRPSAPTRTTTRTFLFWPRAARGVPRRRRRGRTSSRSPPARHEYYDHYQDLRGDDPQGRRHAARQGRGPGADRDLRHAQPLLRRSEGRPAHDDAQRLPGVGRHVHRAGPASMVSATELFDLEEGEILVTEATSPNWTPAFAIIGACVCDGGGSLTHAATVSREYGIPCVVGTSVATLRIKTGDLIEVDGTRGVVTIVERAAAA